MAVFPPAQQARLRQGRGLPWLMAASVTVVTAAALAGATFLSDLDRRPSGHAAETSSTTAAELAGGPGTVDGMLAGLDFTQAGSPALVAAVGVTQGRTAGLAQVLSAAAVATIERWADAGILIETDGQLLDEYSLSAIDAALSALSDGVLDSLGNPSLGPLRILVNFEGRTLSGDQPYGGPANFFSTNEATNELVLYPQQSVFTIVHELGHAYNLRKIGAGRYAMVLLDPEMRSFLAAAGWEVSSTAEEIRNAVDHMHVQYDYNGSFEWPRVSNHDPLEDFANSFAMYFLDPEALRQASPERHAWMVATFGAAGNR